MIKSKFEVRKIPNPDSDMVSHIHVIVIAPQTKKKVVSITCLNLQKHQIFSKIKISNRKSSGQEFFHYI